MSPASQDPPCNFLIHLSTKIYVGQSLALLESLRNLFVVVKKLQAFPDNPLFGLAKHGGKATPERAYSFSCSVLYISRLNPFPS